MPACTAFGTKSRISVAWRAGGNTPACAEDEPEAPRRPEPEPPHPASTTSIPRQTAGTSAHARARGLTTRNPALHHDPARGATDRVEIPRGIEGRRWRPVRSGAVMAIDTTSRQLQDSKAAGRTLSGEPVRELYTEADLPPGIGAHPPAEDPLGRPGEYPYTRGIHESMYRGRLWTMRQFAGFGTSEETNE